MTAAVSANLECFRLTQRLSWWDPEAECRLVLSQPSIDSELWLQYTGGAIRHYREYGVECALDGSALATGEDTSLFLVAIDKDERMLGGFRVIGPLRSADDSHAVVEWAGQPAQELVRSLIAERVPGGMMEIKSAWIVSGSGRGRALTDMIVRTSIHMTVLLNTRYMMCTAATYLLDKWITAGGIVASVPATPYPDERFETKLMLWDRENFVADAGAEQLSKLYLESMQLLHALNRAAGGVG